MRVRGNERTLFTPENCLNPHFVVTGRVVGSTDTGDYFCDESLHVIGAEQELARHLREQGFEAVLFFNFGNSIYCYDRTSWQILNEDVNASAAATGGATSATVTAPATGTVTGTYAAGRISALGPSGGRRRRRRQDAQGGEQPGTDAPAAAPDAPAHYSRRGLYIDQAWTILGTILRYSTHRVALVLANMLSLEQLLTPSAIEALSEVDANPYVHNIVVYFFKGNTLTNIIRSSWNNWNTFFGTIIAPGIEGTDEEDNRVVSLGSPNALEIRCALQHVRLRQNCPITIRPQDMHRLSERLARACAAQNRGLKYVLLRLEHFVAGHPGHEIVYDDWREIVGAEGATLVDRRIEDQIGDLVGMEEVKTRLLQFLNDARGARVAHVYPMHASRFTPAQRPRRHAVGHELNCRLTGGPGTGKTTVARLIGRLYYEAGLLPQGHTIERNAGEIISDHIGGTAQNVHNLVYQALGGVLFIDEAYALTDNQFGQEAINQLVADMSAYSGQFAVVLAGYKDPMDEFMHANDGLARRFPIEYHLPDYTPDQMRDLIEHFAAIDPDGVTLSDQMRASLGEFCQGWTGSTYPWGNAGEAQNLVSQMKRQHHLLLRQHGESARDKIVLGPEDLPPELRHFLEPRSRSLEEARQRITSLIGLKNVKRYLLGRANEILYGIDGKVPGNYIFYGSPGTGKTVTARIMGELLYQLHVLTRWQVREIKASDLLTQEFPQRLRDAVRSARHGVLFIDEAHQLADSDVGRQVIRAFVPIVEDPEIRADTCFILAGYTVEMKHLLEVDSGLERRFPQSRRIRFDDYTAHELTLILQQMIDQDRSPDAMRYDGDSFETSEYLLRSELALTEYLKTRHKDFGNGGFIRDVYLPESRTKLAARLDATYGSRGLGAEELKSIPAADRLTLTPADIPDAFVAWAGPLNIDVHELLESARSSFGTLVGKEEVTTYLRRRCDGAGDNGFLDVSGVSSFIYTIVGPPGTGKSFSARIISRTLHEHDLIERDEVTYVGKGDLEAGYVGQTAAKVREVVDRSAGATLSVVAPSSMLARDAQDHTFGPEALGQLVSCMSDHLLDTAFVLIDDLEGMEAFFRAMPTVRSMVAREFRFEDFTPAQMGQILRAKASEASLAFDEEVSDLLDDFLINWVGDRGGLGEMTASWGNGLEIDRLISSLREAWDNEERHRTTTVAGRLLRVVTRGMFGRDYARYLLSAHSVSADAMAELDKLTGMTGVKRAVRAAERRMRRMPAGAAMPGLYCFLGNPGTGKTTVARLMGQVLRATGILEQGHVVARTARQLVYNPQGFAEAVKLARNGVLFIDEAHQLLNSDVGRHVIKELVPIVEDVDVLRNTCIILAGYPQEMEILLDFDQGLASRFDTDQAIINFEDYSASELLEIMDGMAARGDKLEQLGIVLDASDEEFRQAALTVFEHTVSQHDQTSGNARFVRNFLVEVREALFARLDEEYGIEGEVPAGVASKVTARDLPSRYADIVRHRKAQPAVIDLSMLDTSPVAPGGADFSEEGAWRDECSRMRESVIIVRVYQKAGTQERLAGTGSGFIVSHAGHVLTCAHVVKGMSRVEVRVALGSMVGEAFRWFECDVLEPMHEECDMALIKIRASRANFPTVRLRRWDDPVVKGEAFHLVGYALASSVSNENLDAVAALEHDGTVSSVQVIDGEPTKCYMDGNAYPGDSGAPVFSRRDGRTIGVLRGAVVDGEHSIPYFHPIEYFWQYFVSLCVSVDTRERG